jgi:hypothetical protein
MIKSGQLESVWTEAVVTDFKVLSQNLSAGPAKNHETPYSERLNSEPPNTKCFCATVGRKM